MESCLSKAITIAALTCFLVVGAAAAAILGRDSVPAAVAAIMPSAIPQALVSNKESKRDRLAVASVTVDPAEPPPTGVVPSAIPSEPLRQAFAADAPATIEGLKGAN